MSLNKKIKSLELPELPEDVVNFMMEFKPTCAHCKAFIETRTLYKPGVICLTCQEKIILRRLKHLGFNK